MSVHTLWGKLALCEGADLISSYSSLVTKQENADRSTPDKVNHAGVGNRPISMMKPALCSGLQAQHRPVPLNWKNPDVPVIFH